MDDQQDRKLTNDELAALAACGGYAAAHELQENSAAKKLYFDFKSGELMVGERPVTNDLTVVLDQIYETGFFAQAA